MNKLLIIFARIIVLRWQPINNTNDRQMCKRIIWLLQLYRFTIKHYAYFMRQTPSKQKMKTDDNEKKMLRQTSVIAFQVHGFINHHHLKCIDSFIHSFDLLEKWHVFALFEFIKFMTFDLNRSDVIFSFVKQLCTALFIKEIPQDTCNQ